MRLGEVALLVADPFFAADEFELFDFCELLPLDCIEAAGCEGCGAGAALAPLFGAVFGVVAANAHLDANTIPKNGTTERATVNKRWRLIENPLGHSRPHFGQ